MHSKYTSPGAMYPRGSIPRNAALLPKGPRGDARRTTIATAGTRRFHPTHAAGPPTTPSAAAHAAGLRYVADAGPGIRRKRVGKGFRYLGLDGAPIRDRAELARIRALAIPPSWQSVWICPQPRGHIQATGRDAKGRKQYRYHPLWRAVRDETKYHRMIAFGEALPTIRQRITVDLTRACPSRENVLAILVRLLDETGIRIGNEEYARENEHYGLTTLRNEHVDITRGKLRFEYCGKSGKWHVAEVRDPKLARMVRRCQELPGYELFQYIGDDGERHAIESSDVNEYLRAIAGEDFTAKDFRTWTGTVTAATELARLGGSPSQTEAKQQITQAVKVAAQRLGNTPAICRASYVHPGVLQAYLAGDLARPDTTRAHDPAEPPTGLRREEAAVLALLRQIERDSSAQASPAHKRAG